MSSTLLHQPLMTPSPLDRRPPPNQISSRYSDSNSFISNTPFNQTPTPSQQAFNASPLYAFPVRQRSSQSTPINHHHTNVVSEHTLRRKTPNGTLAAGYDATLVDRSAQAPATKHVLVSSLAGGMQGRAASAISTGQWQPFASQSSSKLPSWPLDNPLQPALRFPSHVTHSQGSGTPELLHTLNPHPSMDSVLNQTLPMQNPTYYFQPGATVPTVLPANFQHYPGPTASIGTDLYGPYWPDGAFIPYRPAPTRDARFYPHLGPSHAGFAGRDAATGKPHQDLGNAFMDMNIHPNPGFNSLKGQLHMIPTPFGPEPPNFGHANESIVNLPYPSQQYHDISSSTRTSSIPEWDVVPRTRPHEMPFVGMGKHPGNVQFKERAFEWAHSIYVDLLASIQRRHKNNPYKQDNQGRRSSKPSIYPKPPRQPGFDSSNQPPDDHRPSTASYGRQRAHDVPMLEANSAQGDTPSSIQRSFMQPQHHQQDHRPSTNDGQRLHSFSDHFAQRTSTLRRASSSAVPTIFPSHQMQDPFEVKAAHALETLEALCSESSEEWVDGMLLAGCLAHGIADYEKAMYWYQRVLDRDNSHVEALSNLAASLCMLNRKEEALSFWMEAVKLRPSYFEAVEHLIALLCSNHRGKEALHIIELVETALKIPHKTDYVNQLDPNSEIESEAESISTMESIERATFENEDYDQKSSWDESSSDSQLPGYGSSGYKIPGSENGRMLSLIHAKANMLFGLRNYHGTSAAFEEAILIATGRWRQGIKGLIKHIQQVLANEINSAAPPAWHQSDRNPILLLPERALQTNKLVFPRGELPGLEHIPAGKARTAAVATTSNALLCLAKIYQDNMAQTGLSRGGRALDGVRDVLALYYLSLSLHPSASTANNIGLLLTSVQHLLPPNPGLIPASNGLPDIGIVPGSPTAVALAFYNYGLFLDGRHSHLYSNLGSLLKDVGQVSAAVRMYEQAVQCEGNFDIALANLANALKDQGRMADAIKYYQRAVQANPDFAEAVCGLATSLNSVCNWIGRGGVYGEHGLRDRWHVDEKGMIVDARENRNGSPGWMKNVINTVEKQLRHAENWGQGLLTNQIIDVLVQQITGTGAYSRQTAALSMALKTTLASWHGQSWEGARIVKLVERASRYLVWQWYQDRYINGKEYHPERYRRPTLPLTLTTPTTPTVLPFHAFTTPLSAKQVRMVSQQNALRMSVATLRSSWLPQAVFPPPAPPAPFLKVGYVSSDFNNHPLAHLMQSVFGFHDPTRVRAICYATTPSDGSVYRQKIESDAPIFYDASSWPLEKLVNQIVQDGIHILINLNGYTRGARNEIFAARPAPISMSFMGFAGTLGAEWCDYLLSDEICIPPDTLSPRRQNFSIEDKLQPDANAEETEDWVYSENIIFTRASFFCCDHRQSGPDTDKPHLTWEDEQRIRWEMRKEIFPQLPDDAIIFGNFNQLYKIDPTTFRTWLRILSSVPNSILWLLRFPDLGEQHLLATARMWAGNSVASRIIFTDVASKSTHISRARVVDLFLDTPECNAHTTSADVVWSGTPVLTLGRRTYKMCSRMAGSIVSSALPEGEDGDMARRELLARTEEEYEETAIRLAKSLKYAPSQKLNTSPPTLSPSKLFRKSVSLVPSKYSFSHKGNAPPSHLSQQYPPQYISPPTNFFQGTGRLMDLREMLWRHRWSSRLFDTRRWVRDLERGYEEAWRRWTRGQGGDIWL